MDKSEANALYAKIKENRRKIDACPRHLFENVVIALGAKATCTNCGGEVGLPEVMAYTRGYIASGKPAEEVYPDWNKPFDR